MEYVEGETLDEYRHRKGRLSSSETEHIISQVASSLAYLHKKDIIHRDIKPQNFKLKPDGTVKMLDFGIAKHNIHHALRKQVLLWEPWNTPCPEQFQQQEELKSDVWHWRWWPMNCLQVIFLWINQPGFIAGKNPERKFRNPRILIPEVSDKLLTVIDKKFKGESANRISAGRNWNAAGKKK